MNDTDRPRRGASGDDNAASGNDTPESKNAGVGSSVEKAAEKLSIAQEAAAQADVENLASRRGEEATEWAISAVREAKAATAEQALTLGVIDFMEHRWDVPGWGRDPALSARDPPPVRHR